MKNNSYNIIKPDSISKYPAEDSIGIFLAGSIEMGVAEDWQVKIEKELEEYPVTIYNPRRDSWDNSWIQRETNPEFNKQVNWEMNKLEESDIIFFNFVGDTKSPISLLELGLHANDRVIVCCPDEFWRKGNVEIVCSRYGIPLFSNLDVAISSLKSMISNLHR